MRQIFAAAILIAASTACAFAGQSGKPRYFVKAWLQKANRSFVHTTSWCDARYRCYVPIAEHMIELRDLSDPSYSLSFRSDPPKDRPCCVFRNGFSDLRLERGYPRVAPLFYRPEIWNCKGVTPFGKLVIVVEDLYKPSPVYRKPSL
ncbi:hypothetical protein [Sinorhizobium americanum]|uniref:hypothetical protein n=1 Tax=Sinorhizobium americanum TaxID=194963 RepID=UPI00055A5B9F|nr:hypothetical protein [Sinorhizobium americanum]OAP49048.1 hypothetical protein ATC00_16760 [Sinorhizobium americanum]